MRSPVKRMLRLADFDEVGHASFCTRAWKSVARLECSTDPQQHSLVKRAADQLHADGKAAARKT